MAPRTTAHLLLHPVRLRVLQAMLGGRRLTTAALRDELADVPAATLYRHVATLVDAGVLEVVQEQRVRGAVERTYALRVEAAQVGADELTRMSTEEHRQAFTAFVAGLLAHFDRYLARGDVDLARDGVGYRQTALWLDDDELEDLLADLATVFRAREGNGASPGRTRRLVASVLMPAEGGGGSGAPG